MSANSGPTNPTNPIGQSIPRASARRLVAGRGRYTDDMTFPRMVHAVFVRSPFAHARILSIDSAEAALAPGVIRVFTGAEIAEVCKPFQVRHAGFPALKTTPQHALALDKASWQGEVVAAVVADSRAEAEDAAELVMIEWEELPAVADADAALVPGAPLVHQELGTNEALALDVEGGDVDAAFAEAAVVVEEEFRFARHTGVTLEPRCIIADYDPSAHALTVHQSHQAPHEMADVYARHLGFPGHKVRVVAPDVGGAFGLKLQPYADEIATCALALLLGRPVKFAADRLESFVSDVHARGHHIKARMAVSADGDILGLEVDNVYGIGAYSQFPRTSVFEGLHVLRMSGVAYKHTNYRGKLRVAYQNKALSGHYRGVGMPVANTVTERLVDMAATELGLDPIAFRRRNYVPSSAYPYTAPTGFSFEYMSLGECLDKLEELVDIGTLRAERDSLRDDGVYRGIGIATFVETTAISPEYYGKAEIRVTAQDGCVIKLEPSGHVRCLAGITDQGQGTTTGIAQIVAGTLGVPVDNVEVITGDSATTPYSAGAFASRGAAIGGEVALQASRALKENILAVAAAILQEDPAALDLKEGRIVEKAGGTARMELAEIAEIGHFRQNILPPDVQPQFTVARHHVPRALPHLSGNGIQLSYLEVDPGLGAVKLLRHAVVHDCGTIINPLLVHEQVRGGTVQGIGSALYEESVYSAEGQMLNASLADYLVPMAAEIPDIEIADVVTPTKTSELGVKGVGEAGVTGASAAILNAINDAIAPLDGRLAEIPATPERILGALGVV